MSHDKLYDVAIAGGGLAGLSLSIQLAMSGYSVVLFEKEKYPFHKVCGEYISLESYEYLRQLGLPLEQMNLPVIKKLVVTSPSGRTLEANLDLGGIGISRYTIDHALYKIALSHGVIVHDNTKADDISFSNEVFTVSSSKGNIKARVCAAAYGKRSNLDIRWERDFTKKKNSKLNNYIGVKYHIKYNSPADTIALHNFKNGYCGISKVEDDKYCLCYLTTASNLKASNNSIPEMEKSILKRNPYLEKIFNKAGFINPLPVTISQISFERKSLIEDHVLMLGDAAGMIAPLCGNGMSMALHSGKIAFERISDHLKGITDRKEMENGYCRDWEQHFAKRLKTGRTTQRLFGRNTMTEIFIGALKLFPFLAKKLIKATHGKPF